MKQSSLTGNVAIVPAAGWHELAPAQWREGRRVVSYTSLAEARQHLDTTLVVKAEDGEQRVLLTCPLRLVVADEAALQHLTRDLCRLFVWEYFHADEFDTAFGTYALYFVPLKPGDVVKGRGHGGPIADGLWLDPELEHNMLLRPHVESVLSGRLARMALPDEYPLDSAGSLEEIRPFPSAWVKLYSGVLNQDVVRAPMSIVRVSEDVVHTLLNDIDARYLARPHFIPRMDAKPSRLCFARYTPRLDRPQRDLYVWQGAEVAPHESAIRQVLSGTRPRLYE